MSFEHDTYIVLDIPSPVKEKIYDIRSYHKDTFRLSLPVEVTLAGSSGNGVIKPGQNKEFVFNTIKNIAINTAPIKASFSNVLRFPGTDIFVLTLNNEVIFKILHEEINNSGIRFEKNPFPYKPHCTLRSKSPITDKEVREILETKISEEFLLETISIYTMDNIPMNHLFTVKLLGK